MSEFGEKVFAALAHKATFRSVGGNNDPIQVKIRLRILKMPFFSF